MNSDSEERAEARDAMETAVRNYVKVVAKENGISEDAIVLGWAGYAEYTSIELQQEDSTGNCTLIPSDQSRSVSRGLLEFGREAFVMSGG